MRDSEKHKSTERTKDKITLKTRHLKTQNTKTVKPVKVDIG